MSAPRLPHKSLTGVGLVLLAACGSDSTAPGGGPPAVAVAVVPATSSLLTSGSQDFTATVTNDPSNSGVAWSITGCGAGPAACGSLSNVTTTMATYTAPTTVPPGTLGVTAVSVRDNNKSFTATVAITAIAAAGQIAFVSNRDGNEEISVTNADGSGVTRLTNNPARDVAPAWSPDGSKILFESNRDGNWEVYVMNADGSAPLNLSNNPASEDPDWTAPAWSPDGSKIVFRSDRDGNLEIYVMNADGSGQVNLTNNAGGDYRPAWSPDGSKIAFMSSLGYGNGVVYVMNADGSGLRNLTNKAAYEVPPHWSPDGRQIAFVGGGASV